MSLPAAERKREGPRKEKKRRLIMRDSESDEEDDGQDSSPPRKKKATSLNPVKQKKEGDTDRQEVVDEELKIDKKKGTGSRDLKQNSSRLNWLALSKDESVSGSDRKKTEGKRNTSEELLVEKERIARLDTGMQRKEMYTEKDGEVDTAVKEREEGFTFKKNCIEKQTIEVEPKVDGKKVFSSDFIKKRREDAEIEEKKVTGKRKVNEDEKRPMRRASQRRDDSEEIKVEKKWVVKADIEQRDKKTSIDYGSYMEEYKFNKKWAAIPVVFKRREAVGAGVKKVKELDGNELDEKRFASPDNKKKDTKVGSDSTADRKRSREALDADIGLKRIKRELKQLQDQCVVTDGKKIKQGHHEHGDERTEPKGDQVLVSKLVVLSGGQMDNLKEKSSLGKSEKTSKPETESVRWMQRSEHRTLRKLKDNSVRVKRADHRILPEKGIRVQGKGGVLTVRPNNKKGRFEKAKESISTATLGKNKSYMKSSLAKKQESCDSKTDLKNKVLSSRNPDIACKGEGSSSSKAPLLTMQNQKEATERRATVRRKITDQIKGILLSAGWKIDLRPRRGKNYEDQVYIPPTGGGGYWSITKAYAAFEKELNHADGNKNKDSSGKSSIKSADGACSSSSAIPAELLSMLKRNIVKKRRRRIEDEETEGGRNKKVKRITKMKHYKNKNSKVKIAGVKRRKNPSSLMRSKAKDLTGKSNTKQRGRTLLVRGSNQETYTHDDGYVPYEWKRTVLSWMIDLRIVSLNGKVKYMNKKRTRAVLEGHIVRDGILCGCCSKILTVSKFEIHAGSKLHEPYENVFVEDSEKSLLQCLVDAWETQDEFERRGFYIVEKECVDPSDDTCGICGDGGDLICCDGCPSTFHLSCLGIEMLPPGDWYCTNCSCRFCRLVSKASAQGSGVPISPLFSCYQCEEKYHQECIPKEDAISTVSDNSPASFCGSSCRKVFRRLQKLLGVKNDMDAGFSWCLIRRLDEDSSSGLSKRAECNAKIAVALAVMDECFLPIIDQRSGFNRIHNIVYNRGSNFNRLNYRGFYTFTLERGDDIISAASVRIHGTRLAEMPFIGTRNMYRRQGMCRRLLSGIESALCSLGIKKLIIPAISELTDTWTTVFGFKPLDMSQEEVKSMNMLVFPGTGLLQKPLLKKNSSQSSDEAGKIEPRIKDPYTAEIEPESSVLSSVGANLHPSNVVLARDDATTVLDCCVPSTSDVAPESFNSPQNSGFQAPEYKSPENAADSILFVQPEAVLHDEPGKGDKGQVDSFDVVKTKLPCKDIVHNNDDLEVEDTSAVINSQAVGETSAQDTSEANTGGNDLHNPVSSLESISNAFAHSKGPVDSYALHNLASSLEPGKGDKGRVDSYDVTKTKLPFEDILHNNDDLEVKDAAAVINSQAVEETSVHYASEANAGGNELHNPASSLESISNASDHNMSEAVHDLSTEVAKHNANDEDAKPNTNGVGRSLTAPFGKESQASNGSCANGNLITSPVCASSGHVLEVSGGEKPYQQNSKPISQSSDFPDEALSFDLHHSSVNAFCSSSLPDPSDSSNDHVLKKSHETSNGLCSFRLIPYIVAESSRQCYTSDIVGKSPGVILEPVSSTSGVKSCNIPAVSPHAVPLIPDAGNNTLDMVEKAVAVQHELKVANEATSGISVEPKAAYSEVECDTGTSKGDSDAAKPTHAFSVGSSHSALELVKVSLGNVSESADGSPDIDI